MTRRAALAQTLLAATPFAAWWAWSQGTHLDTFLAPLASRVQGVHVRPELDPQPVEIGPDGTGVRVAAAEAPIPDELQS